MNPEDPSTVPPSPAEVSGATPSQAEIVREIAAIRQRLDVLEQAMRSSAAPVAPPATPPAATPEAAAPVVNRPVPRMPQVVSASLLSEARPSGPLAASLPAPLPAPIPQPKAPHEPAPRDLANVERLVGSRWYAAAGAIALVIGLALFAKLAHDQGWLRVPPGPRCVLVAIVGMMLIGAGEFIRRRFTVVGSIGLYAAGLGALYAAPLAATRLYDLIHPGWAFLLLALVSALGIAIASRLRFILVAMVSLVGAYLAPMLLSTGEPSYYIFPAYLLLLLVTGLILSSMLRGHFVHLRSLVWAATVMYGGFWALSDGVDAPLQGLSGVAFVGLAWAFIHAELLLAARFTPPEAAADAGANGVPAAAPIAVAPRPFWRALALSISTSAWASLLVTIILETTDLAPKWTGVAAFAIGSAIAAVVLAGHLRFMVDSPRSATERLGAVLALEAASLLIVTIALALSGVGEIIAYMALAACALAAAAWMRTAALVLYASVLAMILSLRLCVYDSQTWLNRSPIEVAGLALTYWTLLVLVTSALWMAAAWCVQLLSLPRVEDDEASGSRPPAVGSALASALTPQYLVASVIMLLAAFTHPDARAAAITTVWILIATALAFVPRLLRVGAAPARNARVALSRIPFVTMAPPVTVVALVPLGLIVTRDGWAAGGSEGQIPVIVHATFLLSMALVAAALILPRQIPVGATPIASRSRNAVVIAFTTLATFLFIAATSAEAAYIMSRLTTDPTTQLATISIWWALIAVASVIIGFVRALPVVRRLGLAFLGVAALKFLVVDLSDASPVTRIASFMSLGVLMLGVAILYARVARQLDERSDQSPLDADLAPKAPHPESVPVPPTIEAPNTP